MELNLEHLTRYQAELAGVLAKIDDAKRQAEFLRLQAKQTKQAATRAKKSAAIKAFITHMPCLTVEVAPSSSGIYVSVSLSPMQSSLYLGTAEFDALGLELIESRKDNERLSAPTVHLYRTPAEPGVHFYITVRQF